MCVCVCVHLCVSVIVQYIELCLSMSGLKAKIEGEAQRNSSCHSICRFEGVKVFPNDA